MNEKSLSFVFEQPISNLSGIPVDGHNILRALESLRYLTLRGDFQKESIFHKNSLKTLGPSWKYSRRLIDAKSNLRDVVYLYQQVPPKPFLSVKQQKSKKQIFRVHDIFPLTYPNLYTFKQRFDFRRRMASLKEAGFLLYNSSATKKSVEDFFEIEFRGEVLECLTPSFAYTILDGSLEENDCCSTTRKLPRPFIFSISPYSPRKQTTALVAFWEANIRERGVNLVIVTPKVESKSYKDWAKEALKRSVGRLHILNRICNNCICFLHQSSSGYVSNSVAEGFNMPLHDAMFFKKPILSTIGASPDVREDHTAGDFIHRLESLESYIERVKTIEITKQSLSVETKSEMQKSVLAWESKLNSILLHYDC